MGTYDCGFSAYRLNATWFRTNWCWVVRVLLALIGAMVPLIMWMIPCEDKPVIVVKYRPLDVYIVLDGSSSMGWDDNDVEDPELLAWTDAKIASTVMLDSFATFGFPSLQVAAMQFSSQGEQEVISELTTEVDSVTELISAQELNGGGTYLAPALTLARDEFSANGFDSSALGANFTTAQLVIIITDGENSDQSNALSESNALKNDDIFIKGIMVRSNSIDNLFEISTCDEWTLDEYSNCTFFTLESSFENLKLKADEIALEFAGSLALSITENRCVKAEFLIFLILLFPFVCVCLFPYCKKMKKKEVRRISMYPVAKKVPPPPPPAAIVQAAPPKLPEQPKPKVKDPRFKWQIKAHDQYLWNLGGGGASPLKVDFAGKAPPSAPKDPNGVKIKVAVETWEDDEGYICAEVEEPVTFEEYTEAKVAEVLEALGLKDTLKKFCCSFCCCCCTTKPSTPLPNAPVVSEDKVNRNRELSFLKPVTTKMKDTWSAPKRPAGKPNVQLRRVPPKPKSGQPPKRRGPPPKPRGGPPPNPRIAN